VYLRLVLGSRRCILVLLRFSSLVHLLPLMLSVILLLVRAVLQAEKSALVENCRKKQDLLTGHPRCASNGTIHCTESIAGIR
jgi:hypothetical protein